MVAAVIHYCAGAWLPPSDDRSIKEEEEEEEEKEEEEKEKKKDFAVDWMVEAPHVTSWRSLLPFPPPSLPPSLPQDEITHTHK